MIISMSIRIYNTNSNISLTYALYNNKMSLIFCRIQRHLVLRLEDDLQIFTENDYFIVINIAVVPRGAQPGRHSFAART